MTHMFDSFDNQSDDYVPNNSTTTATASADKNATYSLSAEHPIVDTNGYLLGVEFNLGDDADITFEVKGFILDSEGVPELLEDVIKDNDSEMTFTLYDHFYNEVMTLPSSYYTVASDDKVYIMLSLSRSTTGSLARGIYHIGISIGDYTLYSSQDAMIRIV